MERIEELVEFVDPVAYVDSDNEEFGRSIFGVLGEDWFPIELVLGFKKWNWN